MTRRQLRHNLQLLNDVRGNSNPRAMFVHATREHLLSILSNTGTTPRVQMFSFANMWLLLSILIPPRTVYAVVRPLVLMGLAFGIATGSWATGAFASLNSVPGDVWYPVKIGIENTTVAVVGATQGTSAKTKLQAEYATRRLDEAQKVMAEPEKAKEAVQRFQDSMTEVNATLEALKTTDATVAVEIAKNMDVHATRYLQQIDQAKVLAEAAGDTSVKDAVHAAESAVVATGDKTVEVYVESLVQGSGAISKEEVREIVDKKLSQIESRVADVTEDINGAVKSVQTVPLQPSMIAEKSKVIAPAMQVQRKTEEVREAVAKTKVLLEADNVAAAALQIKALGPATMEVTVQARIVQKAAQDVDTAAKLAAPQESAVLPRIEMQPTASTTVSSTVRTVEPAEAVRE
jgi:Domain of unknown function (DUF5667)